jgi:hypothetical protein
VASGSRFLNTPLDSGRRGIPSVDRRGCQVIHDVVSELWARSAPTGVQFSVPVVPDLISAVLLSDNIPLGEFKEQSARESP